MGWLSAFSSSSGRSLWKLEYYTSTIRRRVVPRLKVSFGIHPIEEAGRACH